MSQQASKVAIVVGATRGIGRSIALNLASHGYAVTVLGKTTEDTPKLPGSVFTVAEEIKKCTTAKVDPVLALACDVRDDTQIARAVQATLGKWGTVDLLVYNSGAILWQKVKDTPLKRFDLMHQVNLRGFYAFIQHLLPIFEANQRGRFIVISPPIYSRFVQGKTPYSTSKIGASVMVLGLGHEFRGTPFAITGLWPATAVEAHVTVKNNLAPHQLRKADIMADACREIAEDKAENVNGKLMIDEDYLRLRGYSDSKITSYRCVANSEPPRMMPRRFPDLTVDEERQQQQQQQQKQQQLVVKAKL